MEKADTIAKWIPIGADEPLPEIGTVCLFWFAERNEVFLDYLEKLSSSDGGGVQTVFNYLHNYSHWMPLPEAPTD